MARPRLSEKGYPLSLEILRDQLGTGKMFDFLTPLAIKDMVPIWQEDFTCKAISTTTHYTVAAGAGATTWAINVQENGVLRGVTGATAATSGLLINTPKIIYGDRNPVVLFRFKASSITDQRLEMGFADALPSVNTPIVNSLVTPTFNTAADAALYVYNQATGAGTVTSGLYTIGTAITAAKTATTTKRPVAATYQWVGIEIRTNRVYLMVDGDIMVSHNAGTTDYIEGGSALSIVFSALTNTDSTSNNVDIDCIYAWAERN